MKHQAEGRAFTSSAFQMSPPGSTARGRQVEVDILDVLNIDELLERLESDELKANVHSNLSMPALNTAPTTQPVSQVVTTPLSPANTAAAAAIMPRQGPLPNQFPFPPPSYYHFHAGISSYPTSVADTDTLPRAPTALQLAPLDPYGNYDFQKQGTSYIYNNKDQFSFPVEASRVAGSSMSIPLLLPASQPTRLQRSVSSQELNTASYKLFNVPPYQLPDEVCNSLKESLASQV